MSYSIENLMSDIEHFKKKLRIAVIYGGDKESRGSVLYQSINTRNWKSYRLVATEIADSLTELGFRNVELFCDDMNLTENLKKYRIEFVWLNTGGVQGVNPLSHTPALLEMLGIPFIGHNSINSTLLDNKHLFKHLLNGVDIKTPKFLVLNLYQNNLEEFIATRLPTIMRDGKFEFIVKPVSGRGSVNVFYVESKEDFIEKVQMIFESTKDYVLVEEYLSGREFCVAVHGSLTYRDGNFIDINEPFAFSTIERVLDIDEKVFTSMDKRPITQNRIKFVEDTELSDKLEHISKNIYQIFNIETLIRLDIRADENNELYVLEANPKPDLKKAEKSLSSLISLGLSRYNIGYNQLILQLFANTIYNLFRNKEYLIGHLKKLR